MATIQERVSKDGGRTYKFRTMTGKEADGKRIFAFYTWKPPAGLTHAKERKLAEVEAYKREKQVRGEEIPTAEFDISIQKAAELEAVPEEDTFRYFVEKVWMPFKVIGGGLRPSTIAMYGFMMRVALPFLGDKAVRDITAIDILTYLQYLREEYRALDGRTLSEKSVKHHYDILRIIFNYAERMEVTLERQKNIFPADGAASLFASYGILQIRMESARLSRILSEYRKISQNILNTLIRLYGGVGRLEVIEIVLIAAAIYFVLQGQKRKANICGILVPVLVVLGSVQDLPYIADWHHCKVFHWAELPCSGLHGPGGYLQCDLRAGVPQQLAHPSCAERRRSDSDLRGGPWILSGSR